ncbi:ClpP family protease [Nakamurella deserti]|uniref:ClpP family protease n=1 Tax=Nakamurella deserti TaxID=2164074 RepID=UPI000DBE77C3|nr:ATP-dependent Clp protease proteolytic subunit [Nakamurella deserti]
MTDTPPPGRDLDEGIYRRLFERRTLLLGEPLEHWNSNRLCTGLLLLAAENPDSDIRLLINSPGGSVPGMLAIRDCMRAIPNDVVTVNLGMAYSAGQFLLSAGTPGRRYALARSKVLLHQGSAGIGGTAQDIAIQADDLRHTRDTVLGLIAADTGRPVEDVERDSLRDRWFDAEQALAYGFVDHIVDSAEDILPAPKHPIGLGARR